ncbi:MAG TPA: UpxY family transcription antiterminator [Flavobacterium sp.]|uniref:UpxY family transcription antiterminator n=1 Tax=Flavobacterium sp. TaxID=239 RepID=UPI002BFF707A|nr:UpxY family transcription antiterminator [Flavobacterium sp.]HNP33332.1 UpxY family transcription antiterminator [Flavobacterium sp.]
MPWYALYTEPRQEKKVTARLQRLNIEVYCPLIIQVRQWSDRKKKVEVPLLPSYVFVKMENHNRELVFQVSGVVRYLYWLGQPAIVKDSEIEQMQKWLQNKITSFEIVGIEPGTLYEIPSGPFIGQKGIVEKVDKNQITLVLEQLGVKIILHK